MTVGSTLARGCTLLACASVLQVQAQMHPPEPTVNLGDTSFLDGIAGPGYMVEEIVEGDHSAGASGGKRSLPHTDPASNAISGLTHVAWIGHHTLLGGWYGLEVVQAVAHVNAGPGRVVTGAGDLTASPLLLQWNEKRLGRVRVVQRFVLDMDFSTGEYRPAAPLSLSAHAFDLHPYYAVTLFPTGRLETSWRFHYLWNALNHQPPAAFQASSTQAAQAVHFNATVGYRITQGVWAGLNGYLLKTINDPHLNNRPLLGSPEQVGALGPGLAWDSGHWILYANGYREFGAENRPAENKFVLRVQWLPNRKGHQL